MRDCAIHWIIYSYSWQIYWWWPWCRKHNLHYFTISLFLYLTILQCYYLLPRYSIWYNNDRKTSTIQACIWKHSFCHISINHLTLAGKYILQSLIGAQEHRDGLRLTPLKVDVEVNNAPVDGVQFSQSLATLHGTVKCIGEDCVSVTVHVSSAAGVHKAEVHSGIWRVSGVLPGEYKVLN